MHDIIIIVVVFAAVAVGRTRQQGIGEECVTRNFMICTTQPNTVKSKRWRMAAHVVRMGEMRGVYRDLVGKPEGKRSLGRLGRIRKGKITMDPLSSGMGEWTGWIWLSTGTGGGMV
jgi:hypothetical protein